MVNIMHFKEWKEVGPEIILIFGWFSLNFMIHVRKLIQIATTSCALFLILIDNNIGSPKIITNKPIFLWVFITFIDGDVVQSPFCRGGFSLSIFLLMVN